MLMYAYTSEMNDNYDTRKELGLFYYKVLTHTTHEMVWCYLKANFD